MLYLYTGVPGSGKTLHMVSQLHKDPQFKERTIYVDGITDLDPEAIPHQALPDGCNGSNWQQWLPDKAILIIDECQRYWRPRANGSRVPDAVQAMETHRHQGIDIYLLTQDAKKIDSAIRGLIEVHKHFSMSQLGVRRCFEWRNKVGDPSSKTDVKAAIITPYFLDESVYSFYTSSVQHNSVKAKKSKWVYGLPIMLTVGITCIIWGLWTAYQLITGSSETSNQAVSSSVSVEKHTASIPLAATDIKDNFVNGLIPQADNQEASHSRISPKDYIPDFEGQPWTAPVYKHLNQDIKTMPFPVACVKSSNTCTCYTDQATPIRNMDKGLCMDFAENGIYNPYLQNENPQNTSQVPTDAQAATIPSVQQMGGKPLPSLTVGDSDQMAVIQ